MNRIKVAVMMGGKTPEHEISLVSGREVVKKMPRKYEPYPVIISRDGSKWTYVTKAKLLGARDPLTLRGTSRELAVSSSREINGVRQLVSDRVDVCFIAMHGPFGEDGTVQGMLELAGIPYTGSGVLASALGMDKLMFRRLMAVEKVAIPKFVALNGKDNVNKAVKILGKPPFFVKPNSQGSSIGVTFVRKSNELTKAVRLAFSYDDIVLVDECIYGTEVTCAVLGTEEPFPMPLVEIIPKHGDFFNYNSKYKDGGADEIVPARVSLSVSRKVQNLALKVYQILGCKGFSRVDFILKDKKLPVVLEINTIPGLTPMSLLPKAAKAQGISYTKLIDRIIKYAVEK